MVTVATDSSPATREPQAAPVERSLDGELILPFRARGTCDARLVGIEGVRLNKLCEVPDVSAPAGFFVTTAVFRQLMELPDMKPAAERLETLMQHLMEARVSATGPEIAALETSVQTTARAISQALAVLEIPADIQAAIAKGYHDLAAQVGPMPRVTVASSVTAGESPDILVPRRERDLRHVLGEDDLIAAVRARMREFFSERAIRSRTSLRGLLELVKRMDLDAEAFRSVHYQLQAQQEAAPAVSVQALVNPRASGVAYNVNVATGEPQILVQGNFGLVETITHDIIVPDTWFVDAAGERILEQRIGSKERVLRDTEGRIMLRDVKPHDRRTWSMEPGEVLQVARELRQIHAHLLSRRLPLLFIKTQFSVDESGQVHWLRVSPERYWSARAAGGEYRCYCVDPAAQATRDATIIFEGGETAAAGAVTGTLCVVRSLAEAQAARIGKHHIVVAPTADETWEPVLRPAAGLIVDRGGLACWPAKYARRSGKPCLVAAADAFERLCDSRATEVTLDATNRAVYRQTLDLQLRSPAEARRGDIPRETRFERTHMVHHIDAQGVEYIGKPEFPLVGWQDEVYRKAWQRIREDFDVPLRDSVSDGVYCVARDDLLLLSDVLYDIAKTGKLEPLEEWFLRRTAAAEEFQTFSQTFEATPEQLGQLFELYTRLVEHAHLRWQIEAQVLEHLIQDQLKGLTAEQEAKVRQAFTVKEESETQRKERVYHALVENCRTQTDLFREGTSAEAVVSALQRADKSLLEAIRGFAREFKHEFEAITEPVPLGTVINNLRRDVLARNPAPPPAKPEERDTAGWESLVKNPEMVARLFTMQNAHTLQSDRERHAQVRAQWLIRDKLLELGGQLVKNGALRRAEDVLHQNQEALIASASQIEKPHIEVGAPPPAPAYFGGAAPQRYADVLDWEAEKRRLSEAGPRATAELNEGRVLARLDDERYVEVPRFMRVDMSDPHATVQRFFRLQSHPITSGYSKFKEGMTRPAADRFVQIYETGETVDYAVFTADGRWELRRGNYYTGSIPLEEIFVAVAQNSARANRPGRPGGETERVKISKGVLNLRPEVLIKENPAELVATLEGHSGNPWWLCANLSPIFPTQLGEETFPQPHHMTCSRGFEAVDQPQIMAPGNLYDVFDFLVRLNASPSLRGQLPFSMVINAWYSNEEEFAEKAGASQLQAHVHYVRFPFPLTYAPRRLKDEQRRARGLDVFVLDKREVPAMKRTEPPLAFGLSWTPDRLSDVVGMVSDSLYTISRPGHPFNVLVSPEPTRGERWLTFMGDKIRGTPSPHFDNEWAGFEFGRGVVVDAPGLFYRLMPRERRQYDDFLARMDKPGATGDEIRAVKGEMYAWVAALKARGHLRGVQSDLFARTRLAEAQVSAPPNEIQVLAQSLADRLPKVT